jgi:hypothetical protein
MLIMRTFIDTYVCKWSGERPWYLYRDSSLVCLSDEHIYYIVLGLLGMFIYYPLSTFMFPNF